MGDIDVEVIEAIYTDEPPPGYPARDRVFALLTLKNLTTDEEADEYLSAGALADFKPTPDGLDLIPAGSRTGLNDNSKWTIHISNLVSCGFPANKLDEAAESGKSMAVLKGLQMHVVRIPAPERAGLGKDPGARKETILVPNKLIKLPGEKAKVGRKVTRATQPSTAATQAPVAEATDDATNAALEVVAKSLTNGPMAIPLMKTAALKKCIEEKTAPVLRNQIVGLVGDKDWLQEQGVTVEGGQASM